LAVAWMLGNICLHRLPVPWTIALAVGAAAESSIVFLLLVCGVGNRFTFILLGADRVSMYLAGAALAFYAALYLINALAPEVGAGCHRLSPGAHVRIRALGRLSGRVGFL
jgi:hypothetical protein